MGTGVFRYSREQLIGLLERDALKRGTFTLASGRTSHYYVDGRKVTLSAEGAVQVGAGVIEMLVEPAGYQGRRGTDHGGRSDRRGDACSRGGGRDWAICAAFWFARKPRPTAPAS